MNKTFRHISSAVLGIVVFLFWWLFYPYALSFQEQNQLFLFTWDYFSERISLSGGLADYIAEFITQFSYIPYLGEALLAVVFVIFQKAIALSIDRDEWYVLSFVAPVMMLVYMSDIYVMLSYLVALIAAVLLCALYRRHPGIIWAGIANLCFHLVCGHQREEQQVSHTYSLVRHCGRCAKIDLSPAISLEDRHLRHQLLQASDNGTCDTAHHCGCHGSHSGLFRSSSEAKENP